MRYPDVFFRDFIYGHTNPLRTEIFSQMQQGMLDDDKTFKQLGCSGTEYTRFKINLRPPPEHRDRYKYSIVTNIFVRFQTDTVQPERVVVSEQYRMCVKYPYHAPMQTSHLPRKNIHPRTIFACVMGTVQIQYIHAKSEPTKFEFVTTDLQEAPFIRHLARFAQRDELFQHAKNAFLRDLTPILEYTVWNCTPAWMYHLLKVRQLLSSKQQHFLDEKANDLRNEVTDIIVKNTPLYRDVAVIVASFLY